jgi:hypothetical protein
MGWEGQPVCVFCKRSGAGVTFAIFSPRFPPFGTACVECERDLPEGTELPTQEQQATKSEGVSRA